MCGLVTLQEDAVRSFHGILIHQVIVMQLAVGFSLQSPQWDLSV